MSTDLDRLAGERYVLLTTFRKDGTAVPTPVWAARDGECLVVWTADGSGKVKRIRRDGAVRVGPCDVRGRPRGEDVPAHARLLDAAGVEHALGLIKRKYGIQGVLAVLASRLRRGARGAAAIAIAFG